MDSPMLRKEETKSNARLLGKKVSQVSSQQHSIGLYFLTSSFDSRDSRKHPRYAHLGACYELSVIIFREYTSIGQVRSEMQFSKIEKSLLHTEEVIDLSKHFEGLFESHFKNYSRCYALTREKYLNGHSRPYSVTKPLHFQSQIT